MKHITINDFYKSLFHTKTYKLSLDSGCTCPTRDGTLDTRGCIFCSNAGSGDFISDNIEDAKILVSSKIKNPDKAKYIVYFQNFTSTYGNIHQLEEKWRKSLKNPEVVGLAFGTRPDCLSQECLQVLGKLAEETFVQVELGFQTAREETALYIRRGFTNEVYFSAVEKLHAANPKIHVVTHIIFGLPGDSTEDMMNSVKAAVDSKTDGIKITCLYILQNTDLEKEYYQGKIQVLSEEEYYSLIKDALKLIPENIIIHRLTGDPPKNLLIAPEWTMNKKKVINNISKLLQK